MTTADEAASSATTPPSAAAAVAVPVAPESGLPVVVGVAIADPDEDL